MLELLSTMLHDYKQRSLKEILDNVELPLNTKVLEAKKAAIIKDISSLTKRITKIQNEIDNAAMELYGVEF